MPYFPREENDQETVVLTLKNGDSVTLVEKQMSVADRKATLKRAMLIQYEFKFKQRQAEDIEKRVEVAGLDKDAYDAAVKEGADLMSEISVTQVYATVLTMRFQSWDVFASREDFEAKRPIPMNVDSIMDFASARKSNTALLQEITDLLQAHDGLQEKKDVSKPANSGALSTTIQ